jgi:hypothetical protein
MLKIGIACHSAKVIVQLRCKRLKPGSKEKAALLTTRVESGTLLFSTRRIFGLQVLWHRIRRRQLNGNTAFAWSFKLLRCCSAGSDSLIDVANDGELVSQLSCVQYGCKIPDFADLAHSRSKPIFQKRYSISGRLREAASAQ